MPEATMLVLDNSEFMRNGDFIPTRWGAQTDATTIIFDAKTQSNPENTVGIMTMAGKSPRVLSTFSTDVGKLLQSMHGSHITGQSDVFTGINIAQLALKHRQDKVHTQRIIVFVGSPIEVSEEQLVALGKKLKKNNVALDVINFGEDSHNQDRLHKLVESANSGDNSHFVTVASGPALLSDMIISSPIIQDASGSGAGPSGSGGGQPFEFGVDPSMDPELAMALRMSLEEEQARQRATEGADAPSAPALSVGDNGQSSGTFAATSAEAVNVQPRLETAVGRSATSPAPSLPAAGSLLPAGGDVKVGGTSEDAMLRRALALSQGEGADEDVEMGLADRSTAADNATGSIEGPQAATVALSSQSGEDEEMTEEEAIARAIEMSLQGDGDVQQKE